MYNRYIPDGASYTRVAPDEGGRTARSGGSPQAPRRPGPQERKTPSGDPLERVSGFLSGLLQKLTPGGLDTGDILLLLIILFLLTEGDDLDIVITLGLLFFMGLGDDKTEADGG